MAASSWVQQASRRKTGFKWQSSAHRSQGDTPDPAAVAASVLTGDGARVPVGMPPGDTQSFAHRSWGDTQEPDAPRPFPSCLPAATRRKMRKPFHSELASTANRYWRIR
jgi:hypothetical protein